MKRVSGQFVTSSVASTSVNAFVPYKLPPDNPPLDTAKFSDLNRAAELSLARLSGVAGLVPSVNWLLYSAIRKEALLTSQIEGTQASLTDLFDNDAGIRVQNTADVEEVSNYLAAFHLFSFRPIRLPLLQPLTLIESCHVNTLPFHDQLYPVHVH